MSKQSLNQNQSDAMNSLTLGKAIAYPEHYDASLLQPVPRRLNRQPIGIDDHALPFYGIDTWTAFELSWLNPKGLPQVAIAEIDVPVTSPNLIESKSFKLYLNSFNQHRFADWQQLTNILTHDLSQCAGAPVHVRLYSLQEFSSLGVTEPSAECIDHQDIEIDDYDYRPELLSAAASEVVTEHLYSNLLKSNCLITNQPDWGTVMIRYKGPQIDRGSLLRYIVSFRNHNEFHEQCVERIFVDILRKFEPLELTVAARYTRRGGLDINPYRSTSEGIEKFGRTVRQ